MPELTGRAGRVAARGLAVAAAGVAVLAASGCGPGEEEAADDLRGLSERILAEGRQVVGTFEDARLPVESATGRGELCQMEPAPGATFSLGGRLEEQAPYEEQYETAHEALEGDGWQVSDSGVYEGESWARLTRGDFKLSLDSTVRQGSDALVFGLVLDEDACLDVPEGSFSVPDDLEEVEVVPGPSDAADEGGASEPTD